MHYLYHKARQLHHLSPTGTGETLLQGRPIPTPSSNIISMCDVA